jgi:DNA-binding HxlR family transcriptional regulator
MPKPDHRCPAEPAVAMIGGKWKIPILWHLFDGGRRFSELHRALAPVTQKVLIQHLRQLEADGLVTRTVFAEVPPRVEYALTPRGRSLKPIILSLCSWSVRSCRK